MLFYFFHLIVLILHIDYFFFHLPLHIITSFDRLLTIVIFTFVFLQSFFASCCRRSSTLLSGGGILWRHLMSSPCYDLSSFSLLFSLFLLIDHFPASSRFTWTVVELALQSVLFHLFDLTSLFLIAIIYDNTYIYTTIRDVSSRRVSSFSLGGSVSIGAPGWACISCSIN